MNYNDILFKALNDEHYFTNDDLRVNLKYGYLLSNKDLNEYLRLKDDYETNLKEVLPLKAFNSSSIYYYKSFELLSYSNDYLKYIYNDMNNDCSIISDNYDEMILSRVASELEGTLKIEGINTTRKKILDIISSKSITDNNEQIIYNMYEGYNFIKNKPSFNQENLFKLYNILSYNSLKIKDMPKCFYRDDMVVVGGHDGCDVSLIKSCMDSLFTYVNNNLDKKSTFLPFIAHYYILYVHPYFDYNGRTARMVSLWISILSGCDNILPIYNSEAINDDKANYYKAIDNSRNSHNDLTYFLTYMYKLSNIYYTTYRNINEIKKKLALFGEALSNTEIYYLKRIIIKRNQGWFNYKGFISFCNLDISKQGALKILNRFLSQGILISKINSKNEKVFKINDDFIEFEYR